MSGGEKHPIDFKGRDKWGVLAQGHALFLAKLIGSAGKDVPFYDREAQPLQPQPSGLTPHSLTLLIVKRRVVYFDCTFDERGGTLLKRLF